MTFRWEADFYLLISASMEEISQCAFVCLKALRVLSHIPPHRAAGCASVIYQV